MKRFQGKFEDNYLIFCKCFVSNLLLVEILIFMVFCCLFYCINTFFISPLLQSNKKEKQAAAPVTKKEMKSVSSDSSEKLKLSSLQPHPPSSPSHSESRRSKAERGLKRCLKNKPCDKAPADLSGVKDGASETSTRPAAAVTPAEPQPLEPQPLEPSTKRPIVRLPKTTKGEEKSAAVNGGKTTNSRSPQTPRKDRNRAEELVSAQEVGPEESAANKVQVRLE